jgi:hypothetical protein
MLLILTPWNLYYWKKNAPAFWREYAQPEFDVFLRRITRGEVVIVSFGMKILIEPLLLQSVWRGARLIATPRWAGLARLGFGKLEMARAGELSDAIPAAAFITDSEDDADLLDKVARGILIEPQGTSFRSMERLYLPLRYTMRAKYPFKYFIDQTLFVDMALAIVATTLSLSSLFINIAVVVPLFLAFLCVYEIGYYENDFVGASREAAPSLTAQVERFRQYPIHFSAWLWAVGLTLLGVLLDWLWHPVSATNPIPAAAIWLGILVLGRLVFFFYNRSPVTARVFLYPVLQVLKYASILLILPPSSPLGEALVMSQIVVMSMVYLVYRAAARKPDLNKEMMRVVVVAVIVAVQLMGARGGFAYGGPVPLILPIIWLALRNLKPVLLR